MAMALASFGSLATSAEASFGSLATSAEASGDGDGVGQFWLVGTSDVTHEDGQV